MGSEREPETDLEKGWAMAKDLETETAAHLPGVLLHLLPDRLQQAWTDQLQE